MVMDAITNIITSLSTNPQYGDLVKLALVTIPIIIYAVFIFYFYRFVARKNIIELNLNQYNVYSGTIAKIVPVFFYIVEYIIIMPVLTFIWFGVFSILILFLASNLPLETVLLISAALIASVRVTSFVSENLSQDLAKMLPLSLLAIALTNPVFFNIAEHIQKIYQVPLLFNQIISFLAFIIVIELIMRVFEVFVKLEQAASPMKTQVPIEN